MSDPNEPGQFSAPPPPSGPPAGPPAGPPPGPPSAGPGFPPPGPPPPSFGSPAGAGGASGNRGLWIGLGIAGVIALVAVVVVGILLLAGGDDEDDVRDGRDRDTGSSESGGPDDAGDAGDDPADVVEDLIDAAEDNDCAAALNLLTEQSQSTQVCASEEFALLAGGDVESEVGDAEIAGDTAVVPVVFTSPDGSTVLDFELESVEGNWRVAAWGASHEHDASPSASADDLSEGPGAQLPPDGSSTASGVPNDPAAVIEAFFDAYANADCATAEDLVTPGYLASEGRCEEEDLEGGESLDYELGDVVLDEAAGTATVPVSLKIAGNAEDFSVTLIKHTGLWRIDAVD